MEKIFWVLRYRLSIFCISLIEPVNIVAGDSHWSLFGSHAEDGTHVTSRSPLDHASLVNINKRLRDDWGGVRCRCR